jgi:serine/threonine protein kinase
VSLPVGTRIGAYEIVSALGVGGMGEVYRARDARLDRDVALKVLPGVFADDPERLVRFGREAKSLTRSPSRWRTLASMSDAFPKAKANGNWMPHAVRTLDGAQKAIVSTSIAVTSSGKSR